MIVIIFCILFNVYFGDTKDVSNYRPVLFDNMVTGEKPPGEKLV